MRLLCRKSARLRSTIRLISDSCCPGNGSVIKAQISATIRRAPQHMTNTNMWGVSDPAESARGRGSGTEAGSLTPLSVPTPVLGRSAGGTKRRPTGERGSAKMMLSSGLQAGGRPRAIACADAQRRRHRVGKGPTAL